ncbi:MAG: transglycosylase SLT domain-containing protein [Acidobacteria bacterium]|nr:transglycosylase SLT domain-containing protein [Acidobacteriota bacterium]
MKFLIPFFVCVFLVTAGLAAKFRRIPATSTRLDVIAQNNKRNQNLNQAEEIKLPESIPAPVAAPVFETQEVLPAGQFKKYQELSPAQQEEFIEQQARRVTRMIGNREAVFDRDVVRCIKHYVDGYTRRMNSRSDRLWGEDLNRLFERAATRYAPGICSAFLAENVPPVVGLYLAMIESEYHECLTSPVGAQGMFQFMPDTARGYGLDPGQRCNWPIAARASARYMRDRMNEFGTDSTSVALAIAGYNRSPNSVFRDLEKTLKDRRSERSFWSLLANSSQLDHYFQNENSRYVPKFFAAAIIGETPWAFGLSINPLSTYRGN